MHRPQRIALSYPIHRNESRILYTSVSGTEGAHVSIEIPKTLIEDERIGQYLGISLSQLATVSLTDRLEALFKMAQLIEKRRQAGTYTTIDCPATATGNVMGLQ